jgi:hypothetical protein
MQATRKAFAVALLAAFIAALPTASQPSAISPAYAQLPPAPPKPTPPAPPAPPTPEPAPVVPPTPDPFVKLPALVEGVPGAWIIIAPEAMSGGQPQWEIDPKLQEQRLDLLFPTDMVAKQKGRVVTGIQPGTYTAWNAAGDKASPLSRCTVLIIGPEPPVPPGPTPPGPTPPGPTPSPAPIPDAGFRAMIVYDPLQVLPPQQAAIFGAKDVLDYLRTKCVKMNGQPEFRVWSKAVDTHLASPLWQAAMKRPVKSYPWLLVSDGKQGWEGPLPANAADTLTILKKIGG